MGIDAVEGRDENPAYDEDKRVIICKEEGDMLIFLVRMNSYQFRDDF